MGGRSQRDPAAVGSRYDAAGLCGKIGMIRDILSTTQPREDTCTCVDFARLFEPGQAGFYIDPPYYKAGTQLYQHAFRHEDHVGLASILRAETRPWLASYDSNPVIMDLYQGWSVIEEIPVTNTINGPKANIELLISSR